MTTPAAAVPGRHFVTALARGLGLLACFGHGEKALGNQELARRSGLPKSTVSRLTHTLTTLGYLVYIEESAKYSLGSATLSLGSSMLARLDIRKLAHPLMEELARFSRGTVSLGMRDRLSMLYLDVARGPVAVALTMDMGARIRLASSAMGRAYLSAVSEEECADVIAQLQTKVEADVLARLQAGIAQARRDVANLGVACSFGDWQDDVNAIAIPVRPGAGLAPMAINCGGPAYQMPPDVLLSTVRPRLIELGRTLQRLLGSS